MATIAGLIKVVHDRPGISVEDLAQELGEGVARVRAAVEGLGTGSLEFKKTVIVVYTHELNQVRPAFPDLAASLAAAKRRGFDTDAEL